jgi:hypothetical protein
MSLDRVVAFAVITALASSVGSVARAEETGAAQEAPRPTRVPYVVGGAGITAFLLGVYLLQFANNQEEQARKFEELGVNGQNTRDTAARSRSSGFALIGVGVPVFIAGAVWLAVDRATGSSATALRVAPMLAPHGGGLAMAMSF